jgi:hypothetical protein
MKKSVIAIVLGFALLVPVAPSAHALSCLPLDMYLESVAKEEDRTLVFIGTATAVTKDHTQVVTVTEALKGWVAPKMWITHNYSNDWQYFCSNGPAKTGEATMFFVTIDSYGSFTAVQTLPANSDDAKEFRVTLEKSKTDAGIAEATARDRASEVLESIKGLITALMGLMQEFRYWQSISR